MACVRHDEKGVGDRSNVWPVGVGVETRSASVRIPAAVMAAETISLDHLVEVREAGGRIILEPVRPPTEGHRDSA